MSTPYTRILEALGNEEGIYEAVLSLDIPEEIKARFYAYLVEAPCFVSRGEVKGLFIKALLCTTRTMNHGSY